MSFAPDNEIIRRCQAPLIDHPDFGLLVAGDVELSGTANYGEVIRIRSQGRAPHTPRFQVDRHELVFAPAADEQRVSVIRDVKTMQFTPDCE